MGVHPAEMWSSDGRQREPFRESRLGADQTLLPRGAPFVGFLAEFLLWMLLTFAMAAVATVLMAKLGALVSVLASRGAGIAVLDGRSFGGHQRTATENRIGTPSVHGRAHATLRTSRRLAGHGDRA